MISEYSIKLNFMNINSRLICLVEDDPLIIRLYQRIFKLNNYELKVADNGEVAITLLSGLAELPVVILLDIMMPKLSGFDVLKFIKENENIKSVPVIMLTNLASKEDHIRALDMGAAMYLVKSHHTPKELIGLIESFLAQHKEGTSPIAA